ncbi:MAG: type ISP restriction/modification enzyme [Rhodanobacteraceae bacterium]
MKYATLDDGGVGNTDWTELTPNSPSYYFVPEDGALREEYERGWKITEAMPVNSVGIATARDALTIHFSQGDTWNVVEDFISLPEDEARQKYGLGKDARDWKVVFAQKDLKDSGPTRQRLAEVYYRPFDVRHTYYTGNSRGFHCMPRSTVMDHFFQHDNTGLVTSRLTKGEDFAHAQMTKHITEVICMSPKTSNNGFVFPLWLYPRESTDLLDSAPRERAPNLAPAFVAALTKAVGKTPSPEDTLAYIYAILYAPSYRARYADFLKRDFPRVPLTTDHELFDTLVAIGTELIALHTMQTTLPRITGFPEAGGNEVVKVRFTLATPPSERRGSMRSIGGMQPGTAKSHPPRSPFVAKGEEAVGSREARGNVVMRSESHPPRSPFVPKGEAKAALPKREGGAGRVWINDAQYFEGVPEAVWAMHIGGYRVAEKWLKDRKGRALSYDDLSHYQNVIATLARTLALQTGIDDAIESAGGWPLCWPRG